jgi:adenylate kinase family enzyme
VRVLILGNSGAGKTTMARALAEAHGLERLDLDAVVWEPHRVAEARPAEAVRVDLDRFTAQHQRRVVEGSYGRWVAHLARRASELRFLHPGVDRCLANHVIRRWEPEKYDSPEQQEERRAALEEWVRRYPDRDDEYGLRAHVEVFEGFAGTKRQYAAADLPLLDR